MPFSMTASDIKMQTGTMVVEFYGYKTLSSERPHLYLTPNENPRWFSYFCEQFEHAWLDAKPWTL